MKCAAFLQVALDTPLRQQFYYLPPDALAAAVAIRPGMRVRVPFGRSLLVGVVTALRDQSDVPPEKLRAALELLDTEPVLDAAALALLHWAADYYHHPIGEVLHSALPKLLREGAPAIATDEQWSITAAGRAALQAGELARAPRQRELLQLLDTAAHSAAQLRAALPKWRDSARALRERGWLEVGNIAVDVLTTDDHPLAGANTNAAARAADAEPATVEAPALTAEQQSAIAAVDAASGRFAAFLLHGATGSGKTEVYLQLVATHLAQGRAALVLVPEIGLTPQLVSRFAARFREPLAVLHSGLTDTQRLLAWRLAASGAARIVIGTRSAVFAPVRNLGLIVVDEEHDASFKQQDGGFRYSARDLALVRAQAAAVPMLMGSATPALETLHNVELGKFTRLLLPRRAGQAPSPKLTLIDLRSESVKAGLSGSVLQAMQRHLDAGGQVLAYINRRGFAPTLLCTACGWIAPCSECDARMTVHQHSDRLRCHHCGADRPLPKQCLKCGYAVKPVGQGTERIEATLREHFPGVEIARLDRDVVRHAAQLDAVVERVTSGSAKILVGTQMVTKGHHFPGLSLVVVLNADQGLFNTDYRAAERLAQTIVQVAGRAGREQTPGEVLVQTEFPEHPLLQSLLAAGYEGFARTALQERREAAWPPFSRLAALRASGMQPGAATDFLQAARAIAAAGRSIRLLGPAPAAMAKRAGRYHAQLLIESPQRAALHKFLDGWLPSIAALPAARRVRWSLDVDPIELF